MHLQGLARHDYLQRCPQRVREGRDSTPDPATFDSDAATKHYARRDHVQRCYQRVRTRAESYNRRGKLYKMDAAPTSACFVSSWKGRGRAGDGR